MHFFEFQEMTKLLKVLLSEPETSSLLQHIPSPLNPSHTLGRLRNSVCCVLDSARRPLCLVWNNPEDMAPQYYHSHSIIFKSGDGNASDLIYTTFMIFIIPEYNQVGIIMVLSNAHVFVGCSHHILGLWKVDFWPSNKLVHLEMGD